jgi:hypothetical protein
MIMERRPGGAGKGWGRGMRALPAVLALVAAALMPLVQAERVHAQPSGAVSMNVVVDVLNGLSVFRERSLSFGEAVAGSGWRTLPATSADAGLFRIQGRRNRWVDMVLTPPTELVNGAAAVPYAWQASKNDAANDPAAAVPVAGLADAIRLRDFTAPGSDGLAWIWVHGSVDLGAPGTPLPGGTYTGIFTISVAY